MTASQFGCPSTLGDVQARKAESNAALLGDDQASAIGEIWLGAQLSDRVGTQCFTSPFLLE